VALSLYDCAPPDDSDLLPPPPRQVPDEQNSALLLLHLLPLVEGAITHDELEEFEEIEFMRDDPQDWEIWARPGLRALLGRFIEQYREPLTLLPAVFELEEFEWPRRRWLSHEARINQVRELARVLELRAVQHELNGEHELAVQDGRMLMSLGEKLMASPGDAVPTLVGMAVLHNGSHLLIDLLERGDFEPRTEAELIARIPMLDRHPDLYARTIRCDYALLKETLLSLATREYQRESGIRSLPRWFYKPQRTIRRAVPIYREILAYGAEPPCDRGEFEFEPFGGVRAYACGNSGVLALNVLTCNTSSLARAFDKLLTHERALRVLFALRRYERERAMLPPDLHALAAAVPELGGVPIDPISREPFRYDPGRRSLWSVGEDCLDGGGAGAREGESRWGGDDWVWEIHAPR